MITDIRFAFRQLLKSPGFTALTIITLALGIGMSTAIFTLINDIFLKACRSPSRTASSRCKPRRRSAI